MPDIRQVLSDPNFHALPSEERRKVMLQVDPNFSGLPEVEQNKVIGTLGSAGPAPWKQAVSKIARPTLEMGGAAIGGIMGGGPANPPGMVLGAAVGFPLGKKTADALDAVLGMDVPSLEESVSNIPSEMATGAVMEVGGYGAGKAISAGVKAGANVGGKIFGKLTTAGEGVIKLAAERSSDFKKAMRGKIQGVEIVDSIKQALQGLKDTRGAEYRSRLATIKQKQARIDMTPITQKLETLMTDYNIIKDPTTGEIAVDRIAMNKKGRQAILSVIKTVDSWNRSGDNTAVGLDTLKRQLQDFYSESSQANSFVQSLRDTVKGTITKAVPEYEKMTQGYAQATQLIKDIEAGLMAHGAGGSKRVLADRTLRRIMVEMRRDSGLTKELLDILGAKSGQELNQQVAGYIMRDVFPSGLAGGSPALMLEAGLAKIVSPWFIPAMMASSPRVVGEFLQALGGVSTKLAGTSSIVGRLGAYEVAKDRRKYYIPEK